jgi:Protein of unknown function (DUF2905)
VEHRRECNGLRFMDAGKTFIAIGVAFIAAGLVWLAAARLGLSLGHLPGDFAIERGNFRFYLPLGTSILISAVLTALLWLIGRL